MSWSSCYPTRKRSTLNMKNCKLLHFTLVWLKRQYTKPATVNANWRLSHHNESVEWFSIFLNACQTLYFGLVNCLQSLHKLFNDKTMEISTASVSLNTNYLIKNKKMPCTKIPGVHYIFWRGILLFMDYLPTGDSKQTHNQHSVHL